MSISEIKNNYISRRISVLLLFLLWNFVVIAQENYKSAAIEWNEMIKSGQQHPVLRTAVLKANHLHWNPLIQNPDSVMGILHTGLGDSEMAFQFIKMAMDSSLHLNNDFLDQLYLTAAQLFFRESKQFAAMQSYTYLFVSYFSKGANFDALKYGNIALRLAEQNSYQKNVAIICSNIALVDIKLGDYEEANKMNFRAMEIFYSLNDILQIARCNLSVGSVFLKLDDYSKALEYFKIAQDLFRDIDENMGYSISLTNIGLVYMELEDYGNALRCFFEAVDIDEKNGDKAGISSNYTSIGLVYFQLGNYIKAMEYFNQAREIYLSRDDLSGLAEVSLNQSRIFFKQKKYSLALQYCERGLKYNQKTGEPDLHHRLLEHLSDIYQEVGDYQHAYVVFQKATLIRDSLFNIERATKIATLEEKYLRERLEKENMGLKYANEIQESRILWQKRGLKIALLVLVIVTLSAIVVYISYRKRNAAYKYIVQKNLDLMKKEEEYTALRQKLSDRSNDDEQPKQVISEDEMNNLIHRLEDLMEKERVFTTHDLTIDKLARMLNTNRSYLSHIINHYYQKNYSNYINSYRIKEAMRLLSDPVLKEKYSIDAIASEAGFHTISTFNTLFRKYTGLTPSVFRKVS